jgi:hypothetical protein
VNEFLEESEVTLLLDPVHEEQKDLVEHPGQLE